MADRKTKEFAFDEGRKESFVARLKELIGDRSARAAAKDWGLSFSTLSNYLNRGTEPSFMAMQAIAQKEQVSLDWIAFGSINAISDAASENDEKVTATSGDALETTWGMIYKSLSRSDVEALISLLLQKGAQGVLSLSNCEVELELALLQLPKEEKQRLMALHDAKKGASENNQITGTNDLTSNQQEAV